MNRRALFVLPLLLFVFLPAWADEEDEQRQIIQQRRLQQAEAQQRAIIQEKLSKQISELQARGASQEALSKARRIAKQVLSERGVLQEYRLDEHGPADRDHEHGEHEDADHERAEHEHADHEHADHEHAKHGHADHEHADHGHGGRNEFMERIEHLHIAAEHLHAAGMPDIAEEVLKRARHMEQEHQRERHGPVNEEVIHDLQQQVRGLHEHMRELHQQLGRMERFIRAQHDDDDDRDDP